MLQLAENIFEAGGSACMEQLILVSFITKCRQWFINVSVGPAVIYFLLVIAYICYFIHYRRTVFQLFYAYYSLYRKM